MSAYIAALQLTVLVVTLVSFASSLSLLRRVWALDRRLAEKLMARQLWSLALADALQGLIISPKYVLAVLNNFYSVGSHASQTLLDSVCAFSHLDVIPFITSVFIEVHIALATVFCIMHFPRALTVLSRILPSVWLVGSIAGGVLYFLSPVVWDQEVGGCNPKLLGEHVKAAVITGALGICICSYVAGLVAGARHAGESVFGRQWRQATLFVGAAVVTWLPFVALSLLTRGKSLLTNTEVNHVLNYITYAFVASNGSLNAAVYAYRNRSWRKAMRARRLEGHFNPDACLSTRRAAHQPGSGSYPVMFREPKPDSFIEVPAVTATANERAERQMAGLGDSHLADLSGDDFLACFDHSNSL